MLDVPARDEAGEAGGEKADTAGSAGSEHGGMVMGTDTEQNKNVDPDLEHTPAPLCWRYQLVVWDLN